MTQPAHARLTTEVLAYNRLRDEYSEGVADTLTQRSLQRNGIDTTDEEVRGWHRINDAAMAGQLNIAGEQAHAEHMAQEVVNGILGRYTNQSHEDADTDDGDHVDDDTENDESEYLSPEEMYGSQDDDDGGKEYAEEAAYDDVLKIMERGD